jgi:hypothetical protein
LFSPVRVVEASYNGKWELPVLGLVAAPVGVLIRPDGYVGWVGDQTPAGLTNVLNFWFGPPTAT